MRGGRAASAFVLLAGALLFVSALAASDEDIAEEEGHHVREQVAELFSDLEQGFEMRTADESSGSSKRGKSKEKSKSSRSDKREIQRLKAIIQQTKLHQSIEMKKLKAMRKGVEGLLASLNGTRSKWIKAKKESTQMQSELNTLHAQAKAAAQLEAELLEIQKHATVNYETGTVQVAVGGEQKVLSLDEVAAKVGQKDIGEDESHDAVLYAGNLADPAVLHADMRLLLDIVVLVGASALGGMFASVLRLPPILGYIAAGIIVGPSGFSVVKKVVQLETLSSFGSIFFLFAHGMEYSFEEQRKFQSIAVGGCLLSCIMSTFAIQMYAVVSGIADTPLEGGLLGISSSLSSLSVVLGFLVENKVEQTTHAKVMIGFLAFQGLLIGVLFSIPPALSGGSVSVGGVGVAIGRALIGVSLIVSFAYLVGTRIVPQMLHFLSQKSEELFLLGVVSLAMTFSLLTELLGLSLDLGASFAGLVVSATPFSKRTRLVIKPLAAIFSSMLFASIGMIINPAFLLQNIGIIMSVVVNVCLIKFFVITVIVRMFNYPINTAIICGITLAHISEFSLLFSSKLQANLLLSRRGYLIFLSATVLTLFISPLYMRLLSFMYPNLMRRRRLGSSRKTRLSRV